MQENKRVYPSERKPGKWLSYLLLFLSAVVLLSGALSRETEQPVLEPVPTVTPIPLDEGFDETVETREITLPGGAWYALQLGAFEEEKSARELADRFAKRGAAGYVWPDGRYRALAAIYPAKEDAQNVRHQLLESRAIETWLYEIPLQSLTLRMKGMKGQIDILEAAFAHATDLVASLQGLSVEMDRREKNAEEAIATLNALGQQAELVALRLKQRFTPPRNQTVQGLCDLFEEYAAFAAGISPEESAVSLGQKIKERSIHSLYLTQQILNALGNT